MRTRAQQWGNSLRGRFSHGLADAVDLGAGAEVSLSAKDGELIVKPAVPVHLSLDNLLAGVSVDHLHSSLDAGSAVGVEIF